MFGTVNLRIELYYNAAGGKVLKLIQHSFSVHCVVVGFSDITERDGKFSE